MLLSTQPVCDQALDIVSNFVFFLFQNDMNRHEDQLKTQEETISGLQKELQAAMEMQRKAEEKAKSRSWLFIKKSEGASNVI